MGYINTNSAGLFGEGEIPSFPLSPKERKIETRKRKAKQAYDATSEAWKKATYRFAIEEYLPKHVVFLFEELTQAYNDAAKSGKLPITVNGKAFAGLQRRLIKEGRVEIVEGITRTRSNGQPGIVYRTVKE